jgi:hypothetical protein
MKNQMEKKNRIENLEEESRLKICNQTFINKIDLDKSIKWNALVGIILFSLLSRSSSLFEFCWLLIRVPW